MRDTGFNSSMVNGARIIGPSLAGVIMARFGVASCYLIDGLSFTAVIVGLLAMRLPKHVRKSHAGSGLSHALGGFVYAWKNPRVLTILSLFAVVGIFGWSCTVLMPAFACDALGLAEPGYGALLAASGAGALGGALCVTAVSDKITPRRLAMGAGVVTCSEARARSRLSRMGSKSRMTASFSAAACCSASRRVRFLKLWKSAARRRCASFSASSAC